MENNGCYSSIPNFNGGLIEPPSNYTAVKVRAYMGNHILQEIMNVIIYACPNIEYLILTDSAPRSPHFITWTLYPPNMHVLCGVLFWAGTAAIILGMGPPNERRRYDVASSLIGWVHTENQWFLVLVNFTYTLQNCHTTNIVQIIEILPRARNDFYFAVVSPNRSTRRGLTNYGRERFWRSATHLTRVTGGLVFHS